MLVFCRQKKKKLWDRVITAVWEMKGREQISCHTERKRDASQSYATNRYFYPFHQALILRQLRLQLFYLSIRFLNRSNLQKICRLSTWVTDWNGFHRPTFIIQLFLCSSALASSVVLSNNSVTVLACQKSDLATSIESNLHMQNPDYEWKWCNYTIYANYSL